MQVYIYRAEIYCDDCGEGLKRSILRHGQFHGNLNDSDDFPQGPYPNGGGEADSPQHCPSCNVFLENPLTTKGNEYVRTTQYLTGFPLVHKSIRAEWKAFYDYL